MTRQDRQVPVCSAACLASGSVVAHVVAVHPCNGREHVPGESSADVIYPIGTSIVATSAHCPVII